MSRKIIFAGTGIGWFPIPEFFLGKKDYLGKFFEMDPSPTLRLYIVLLSESGKVKDPIVTLDNSYLKEFANLDRNYLPKARKALIESRLIKATRAGMQSYKYEILGAEGRSLADKTEDEWGLAPDSDPGFEA